MELPICDVCKEYLIEDKHGCWFCLCGRVYIINYSPNEIKTLIDIDYIHGKEKYLQLLRNGLTTARKFDDIIKEMELSKDETRRG